MLDPPTSFKQKWDTILKECGLKLTRLLVDHHQSQIAQNEQLAEDVITKANDLIIPEFISSNPDVITTIENSIQKLLNETTITAKRFRKRKRTASSENITSASTTTKTKTLPSKNVPGPSGEEGQREKKYPWRPLKLKKKQQQK